MTGGPRTGPEMVLVRQTVRGPEVTDVARAIEAELAALDLGARTRPGQTVAVTAGSRGISNIVVATAAVVAHLRVLGLEPFVVPAMGSHGGATAEGQQAVLARAGITEEAVGCPVRATMDVVEVARSSYGYPLVIDRYAAAADHLVVVNRVKPHTHNVGPVESGLAKMLMVGLGKHEGAATYHRAFTDLGFATVLADALPRLLDRLPVLAGVALVERSDDRTARVAAMAAADLLRREAELLLEAGDLLPRLPVADVDLLLIDEMGKEISGTGFDTNVVGRKPSLHTADPAAAARVRTIAVRGLTAATKGNAIGVGLAELCRSRVVRDMDLATTRVNALTAADLPAAMVPVHLETDREIVDAALAVNGLRPPAQARVVWIRNTLHTTLAACSVACLPELHDRADVEVLGAPWALPFDAAGNLPDLLTEAVRPV